jgi:hypothetical protein
LIALALDLAGPHECYQPGSLNAVVMLGHLGREKVKSLLGYLAP